MFIESLILLGSLALIVKGGDWFVSASVRLAEIMRLPHVVIGSTLVSLATTSPELVVSIVAGLKAESGLAVGNAVGSCLCNMGLILGVMALIKHVDVHPALIRTPLIVMFFLAAAFFLFTLNLQIARLQGVFLMMAGLAYFIYDFRHHRKDATQESAVEALLIEQEVIAGHRFLTSGYRAGAQFLFGAAIVVIGSKFLVESSVAIATMLGIPPILIGVSVVALGTSLPEFVTAIASSRKNVSDLAVGNILGANIANLSLILGSAAALSEVAMTRTTQLLNGGALLTGMGLLLYTLGGRRITRWEGLALITFYGVYLITLTLLNLSVR